MTNKLIAFDLDGTLIMSIPGIAHSVNCTREHHGYAPLSYETICGYVGNGSRKLAERSFADILDKFGLEPLLAEMIANYAREPIFGTETYPGVMEGLADLKKAGFTLTIVSNKPSIVGVAIIKALDMAKYIDENIGGGDGFPLKPAPDALLFLLDKYQVLPDNAWILGDNYTDIEAGHNAGIHTVCADYGYGKLHDQDAEIHVASFADFVQAVE